MLNNFEMIAKMYEIFIEIHESSSFPSMKKTKSKLKKILEKI